MSAEKQNGHAEPFVILPIAMLESRAWLALTHTARLILDRLIVENATHYGTRNGRLIVSYQDFIGFGIGDRAAIARGLRTLIEHGFLEITTPGRWNGPRRRRAARYRLTFLPTTDNPATDEWRQRSGNPTTTSVGKPDHHEKTNGRETRPPQRSGNPTDLAIHLTKGAGRPGQGRITWHRSRQ